MTEVFYMTPSRILTQISRFVKIIGSSVLNDSIHFLNLASYVHFSWLRHIKIRPRLEADGNNHVWINLYQR